MDKINDGGSAFPCTDEGKREEGMSPRDYFAGQFLMGPSAYVLDLEETALRCYRVADAMLKAREAR